MGDLAGGDIGWAIRKRQYAENPGMRNFAIADRLCEVGRFGQKTGAGCYRYEPGRRDAMRDPVVDEIVDDYRKEAGITPRKISDEEIVQRCIYALVNEGARILEEGIAQRASDIDIVYVIGYGFPPFRGGPMLYADTVGLINVARTMQRFARSRASTRRSGSPRRCSPASPRRAGRSTHDVDNDDRREGTSTMADAVIVSTARTGLAKSWRGGFNMTHGATLGGHVIKAAVERAGVDPAEVEDVLLGCALPEGSTGGNIARQAALRAGLPVTPAARP